MFCALTVHSWSLWFTGEDRYYISNYNCRENHKTASTRPWKSGAMRGASDLDYKVREVLQN